MHKIGCGVSVREEKMKSDMLEKQTSGTRGTKCCLDKAKKM